MAKNTVAEVEAVEPEEVSPSMGTCLTCKREVRFSAGFTTKAHPGNHQLPMKIYYHPGGAHIRDIRDRRRFSPTLILRPATERFSESSGQYEVRRPQLAVTFHDGKFGTSDAELQYYLDHEAEVQSGDEGKKMWNRIYLTEEQQTSVAKNELEQVQNQLRELRESKSLLEQAKQSAGH